MDDIQRVLEEALSTSAVSLLEAYGARNVKAGPPHAANEPEDLREFVAIVGFGAQGARGSLSLAADREVIRALGELPDEVGPIRDWVGELANQLTGRLKNKLLKYGLVITLSTPTVFSGIALKVHGEANTLQTYKFETELGELLACLDFHVDDEIQLRESAADEDQAPVEEGEMMLF